MISLFQRRSLKLNNQEIIPSILAVPVMDLRDAVSLIQKSDVRIVHYDIMDNHFVPNISFGFDFVKSMTEALPEHLADIHLMIDLPGHWEKFLSLNPYSITIHREFNDEDLLISILKNIRNAEVRTGLAIKPESSVQCIKKFRNYLDMVLIMSVEPGFCFQSFIPESLEKISEARRILGNDIIIEVDGGISNEMIPDLRKAGADWMVMGGGFFKSLL